MDHEFLFKINDQWNVAVTLLTETQVDNVQDLPLLSRGSTQWLSKPPVPSQASPTMRVLEGKRGTVRFIISASEPCQSPPLVGC